MIQISLGFLKGDSEKLLTFQDYIEDFEFKLNPNKVYDVALDQSNTCTGICIRPLDKSFLVIMEVLNVNTPNDVYRLQLKNFLQEILGPYSIRYLIMEEPLGYITGRRNVQLNKLKSVLMELKQTLNVKVFTTVPVTSWRHGLMPKKQEGDRRKKDTVVRAVLEHYPPLEDFLGYSNIDTDGIEAVGILLGYIARHGVEDGALKIIGKINTRKKSLGCFKYIDITNRTLDDVLKEDFFFVNQIAIGKGGCVYKTYNSEFNLHGNAKMALEDPFTITAVSVELDVLAMLIKMKLTPKKNHVLFMASIHERMLDVEDIRTLFEDGFTMVRFQ